MKRIQLLDPVVAGRIAAGEVIDRPASVVRELVDNALDAHASVITVTIEEGGIKSIIVADDGDGIDASDLPLCCASHATSKVTDVEDLYHLSTMGFRGEALYSIAACSTVTIGSCTATGTPASLTVDNGRIGTVADGGPQRGTTITVRDLFYAIPARRTFLKRPATEATMCKNTLLEKALAFPDIEFKFVSDGILRLHLKPTSRKERILDVLSNDKNIVRSEMLELYDSAGKFSLYAVASTPASHRTDRSHIKVYVNDRPVEEYSMVQAVCYGYGEMLPGGSFPYCYLFITDDPTLVDFNIHPTKREVKLRNKAEIHHAVVEMVRSQVKRSIPRLLASQQADTQLEFTSTPSIAPRWTGNQPQQVHEYSGSYGRKQQEETQKPRDSQWFEQAKQLMGNRQQQRADDWAPVVEKPTFRYIGQAMDLFLIAQKDDELYLVDQHAAHERLLFDILCQRKEIQRLIIPHSFEVERDVDTYLQEHSYLYGEFGIELVRSADLTWEMATIPAVGKPVEKEIVSFIQGCCGDTSEIEKGLLAIIACHAAVKAGDTLDAATASAILEKVFAMESPTCPHGRTFLIKVSKEELCRQVGRT